MASTIILWDTRIKFPWPGPMSAPGEKGVLRVKVQPTTPIVTVVTKILNATHDDEVNVLKIFAHGAKGLVQLGKENLTINSAYRFASLFGHFEKEEGRIELHSCRVADDAATYGSISHVFLQTLANITDAYVYASEHRQLIYLDKTWDPDWEGTVWIFPPYRD
jgi:hypothetical protein